jgi:hypothetical protein
LRKPDLEIMARQTGQTKITGTIGDIIFYKMQNEYFARRKGVIAAQRIRYEVTFQRTRECMNEFGKVSKAGKLLRTALKSHLNVLGSQRLAGRLLKELVAVIQTDNINKRGERNILNGDLELLEGFEFNIYAPLSTIFSGTYQAFNDPFSEAMQIIIPAFVPKTGLNAPEGTSHFRFVCSGVSIDFEGRTFETATSASAFFDINSPEISENLKISTLKAERVTPLILTLSVEFYQFVNGIYYPVGKGRYNAMRIVNVKYQEQRAKNQDIPSK